MTTMMRRARNVLGAAALAAGLAVAPAHADDPTPAQVELSRKILTSVGLKASIDQIVPSMLGQLQGQLLRSHPEMSKPLHETLVSLMPEFNKGEEDVFNDTARTLANRLSEAELTQTLAFFESDAGKKYTQAQEAVLTMLGSSGGLWRQKLTTIMVDRTREEMKKKGFLF